MEIKTKFNIGQTVYGTECNDPMIITQIIITNSDNNFENDPTIRYRCEYIQFYKINWFNEDELTVKKPKPKTVYDLHDGDEYFFLTGEGHIIVDTFDDSELDNNRIGVGSVFLNREEAEKERKRRKIHQQLKYLAGGYEFRRGEKNYCIYFSVYRNSLEVPEFSNTYLVNIVYFETEEQAQNAIKMIGEEVLLRDYFGIE